MNKNLARPKQSERSSEARRKILAATIELIADKGLDGFSLAEVGEKAGVSRGLAGHHFKTREQLVAVAATQLLAPPGVQSDGGLDALLESFGRSLEQLGSTRVRALVTVLSAPGKGAVSAASQSYLDGAERMVEAHLLAGTSAGTIKRELESAATARFLVTALLGEALLHRTSAKPSAVVVQRRGFLAVVRALLASAQLPSDPKAPKGRVALTGRLKPSAPEQGDMFAEV